MEDSEFNENKSFYESVKRQSIIEIESPVPLIENQFL